VVAVVVRSTNRYRPARHRMLAHVSTERNHLYSNAIKEPES